MLTMKTAELKDLIYVNYAEAVINELNQRVMTMGQDIFDKVYEARVSYQNDNNKVPSTMAVRYSEGLTLLESIANNGCVSSHHSDLMSMLMKGDRDEITNHLNGMTIYGMKLTVVDLII